MNVPGKDGCSRRLRPCDDDYVVDRWFVPVVNEVDRSGFRIRFIHEVEITLSEISDSPGGDALRIVFFLLLFFFSFLLT